MSKVKVFATVVIFMFVIAGCGFKGPYFRSGDRASFVPAEFETTEEAIKKAEMSTGAKYCPEKMARAKELAQKGEELYWACRTEEAMKTLAEARKLAQAAEMCQPPPPKDSDGDGVTDDRDQCPGTPRGVKVDAIGCPFDSDGDGVPDYMDKCPGTPRGVMVDAKGCPVDTDGDGVPDFRDKCPETPKGAKVDFNGCWGISPVHFDSGRWDIKPRYFALLDGVAAVLKNNPGLKMEIHGHTDNRGTEKYNQTLSEKRASAVIEYLVKKGIARDRLSGLGFGLSRPVATNENPEGMAMNRRAELKPVR